MCQKPTYSVRCWFDNSEKTKSRHNPLGGYSARKVQAFISENKETLLFRKGREKSGNDEVVLQSPDI